MSHLFRHSGKGIMFDAVLHFGTLPLDLQVVIGLQVFLAVGWEIAIVLAAKPAEGFFNRRMLWRLLFLSGMPLSLIHVLVRFLSTVRRRKACMDPDEADKRVSA
jgi:hypothetical protein